MKITIDTKEDSNEEIRKIIKMLSSLVGERESFSNQPNIFEDDKKAEPTNAFANMFGSEPSTPSKESTEDEEVKVEEKEDVPDVVEYH